MLGDVPWKKSNMDENQFLPSVGCISIGRDRHVHNSVNVGNHVLSTLPAPELAGKAGSKPGKAQGLRKLIGE